MQRQRHAFSRFTVGFLGVVLILLSCSCAPDSSELLIKPKDPYNPYPNLACAALPGYQTTISNDPPFSYLEQGACLSCFDVQAIPAQQENGSLWYPQCLATVVIVIDRDQSKSQIQGWNDLLSQNLSTAWNGTPTAQRLIFGALAYGLDGPQFDKHSALKFLSAQNSSGTFEKNNWTSPAMVCFDYQAVQLIHQGRNLEIIIPQEGTISYQMGLLSQNPLPLSSDAALMKGGLRLIDGHYTDPAYPSPDHYQSAAQLESYDQVQHLLNETQHTIRDLRRSVLHLRLYSSADGQEHILFALISIVVTLLWMHLAIQHSSRPQIKASIQTAAWSIVGWLILRLFKYQLYDMNWVSRFCWYGYYIFQMALPLNMLYLSIIFDQTNTKKNPLPRWFCGIAAAYPVLLGLVFTNDLHQLVFQFDLNGNWSDIYQYGTGYYLIYGYCIAALILSLFLLIKKNRNHPKRFGWIPSVVLGIGIIFYCTGYALGIPFIRNSDITTTICFFSILFFEVTLRSGLIPSNTRYRLLFSSSPLNMQLLDQTGKTVLAAHAAASLDPDLRKKLQSQPQISIYRDPNTLLYGRAIPGGTVVWQEDIRPLNQLKQKIQDAVKRKKAANALLQKEGDIQRKQFNAEWKSALFSDLATEMETKTQALSQAIQELPQSENREHQLAYITLLLCHIKRRCNFFFLTREGSSISGEELMLYLNELSEFAGYAQVRSLVRCNLPDALPVRTAMLCYDFYFSVLSWSAKNSQTSLIGQLQDHHGLTFRILASEEIQTISFPDAFKKAVWADGGTLTKRNLEDSTGLYLTFSERELL